MVGLAAQRAHVVQPIGQLNEHHAHIFHHGEKHFAQRLRFLIGDALPHIAELVDALEFCHAIDHIAHRRAKVIFNISNIKLGIFGYVVQQSSGQCICIHAQIGQNPSDLNRM